MAKKLALVAFGMLKCIVTFSCHKYLKFFKLACQERVTGVNNTKSQAKFVHVAFSLVFIGIFRLFRTKCGYFLRHWEL